MLRLSSVNEPPRPVGIIIVRAWFEDDSTAAFRARITQALDLSRADEVVSTVATPEQVYTTVRAWLEALMAGGTDTS
jgi:uncharacterized NAD(P)/FAD-binding protein YdhS